MNRDNRPRGLRPLFGAQAACRQDQRLLFDVDRKGHVASLLTERPLDRRTIRDSESERSHSRLVIRRLIDATQIVAVA